METKMKLSNDQETFANQVICSSIIIDYTSTTTILSWKVFFHGGWFLQEKLVILGKQIPSFVLNEYLVSIVPAQNADRTRQKITFWIKTRIAITSLKQNNTDIECKGMLREDFHTFGCD